MKMPPARIILARTLPDFPAVTCLRVAAIQTTKNKKPVMIGKDARQSRYCCRAKLNFHHYVGSGCRKLNNNEHDDSIITVGKIHGIHITLIIESIGSKSGIRFTASVKNPDLARHKHND
jgi:hypothetical protein